MKDKQFDGSALRYFKRFIEEEKVVRSRERLSACQLAMLIAADTIEDGTWPDIVEEARRISGSAVMNNRSLEVLIKRGLVEEYSGGNKYGGVSNIYRRITPRGRALAEALRREVARGANPSGLKPDAEAEREPPDV